MEFKSVADGHVGTPLKSPISILRYGNSTVDFQVQQVWKSNGLQWLSVHYDDHEDVATKQCVASENVIHATSTLTASCIDGSALVDLFVYDDSFQIQDSGLDVPKTCKPWEGADNTIAFRYAVPCSFDQQSTCTSYDEQQSTSSSCTKDVRVDTKSVSDHATGDFASLPVTVVAQTGDTVEFFVEQTWSTERPIGWLAVEFLPAGTTTHDDVVEYDMYTCKSSEFVAPNETTPTFWAKCDENGIAEINVFVMDCSFEGIASDNNNNVDAMIRDVCDPPAIRGRKAHFHFSLPCSCLQNITDMAPSQRMGLPTPTPTASDKASGDDNDADVDDSSMKRTAAKHKITGSGNDTSVKESSGLNETDLPTTWPSSAPSWKPIDVATNNLTCDTDIFEDYESAGQSESWENGLEYDDEAFSTFLGRLGSGHPTISKTFHVPPSAEYLELSFDFYDIDGMPSADQILMGVQNSYLDLQLFTSNGQKKYYNDIEVTREAKANRQISFRVSDFDTIYSIHMKVPKYWYRDYNNTLPIGFRVVTKEAIATESYGVDNLRLHAVCLQPPLDGDDGGSSSSSSTNSTQEEADLADDVNSNSTTVSPSGSDNSTRLLSAPVAEPDANGDDGSYYCSARDFPCGDDEEEDDDDDPLVYVCHYSAKLGYQTFCVPEPDSEVLRFYKNDYCGPCVGGFANHQQAAAVPPAALGWKATLLFLSMMT
jgi:hypothetical protein